MKIGEMTDTFPVNCQRLFRSLTIYMSFAIIVPVTLIMVIRLVSSGFSYAKTFENMSPMAFISIFAFVPAICGSFAYLISLWYRLATITISEDSIQGRSYWGRKNRIPFHDITKLTPFSHNGIRATVVNSKNHGQIFISDMTVRLPELLTFLEEQLSDKERKKKSSCDNRCDF